MGGGIRKGKRRGRWPSDVRELANAGEVLAVGGAPLAERVKRQLRRQGQTPRDRRVEEYEREIITEALNSHHGRITECAE